MSDLFSFKNLDVIGYVGHFAPERWPVRLLPVYRERTQGLGILPPIEEHASSLQGVLASPARLEEMIEEGEVTLLPEKQPAQRSYLLWMAADGIHYLPNKQAEQELTCICISSIRIALATGLSSRDACTHLYRSLRAKETAVAHALLLLHFQLLGAIDSAEVEREDIRRFLNIPSIPIENELAQIIRAANLPQDALRAIATELKQAGRVILARILEPSALTSIAESNALATDLFSARVLVPNNGYALPFSLFLNAIRALFDLFLAAAASEVRPPERHFVALPKEARDFAANLLVPAPAHGSFVMNIECPHRMSDPLGRKVMVRVMRGLHDASVRGSSEFQSGLNANMCDALIRLHEGINDLHVDFGFQWDTRVPTPDDVREVRSIRYSPHDFQVFYNLAEALQRPRDSKPVPIIGYVAELRSRRRATPAPARLRPPASPLRRQQRLANDVVNEQVATISATLNNRRVSLQIALNEDDYVLACEAHLKRKLIEFEGIIDRGGRHWKVMQYDNFRLSKPKDS